MSAALKIKVFDNKGTHLVPISKSTATVGSAAHCDLVLDHSTVQPEHVRVWCEGGRVWVQDLGGPTGTTLNGIRLPHLKPMLVRELDILKLGDCPATLGLEPNLVRAPVVRAVSVPEFTLTDVGVTANENANAKPIVPSDPSLDEKLGELERVSRELADMKLQLQMARLERGSVDELPRQIADLQDELRRVREECDRLRSDYERAIEEKRGLQGQFDHQVAELKIQALREAKAQRDEDRRAFENWKLDASASLGHALHSLLESKSKSTRAFSREVVMEWDRDFQACVKRTFTVAVDASASSEPPALPKERRRLERRRRRPPQRESLWSRVGLVSVGVAMLLTAFWMIMSYMKSGSGARHVASRVESSESARAAGMYRPAQTPDFKASYTDNALFTTQYLEAELNADFRNRWREEFLRSAKGWKLDDTTAQAILHKEYAFLRDLERIRGSITEAEAADGVARMRAREKQFTRELSERLKRRASVDRFLKLKRAFFSRNPVYPVRENR